VLLNISQTTVLQNFLSVVAIVVVVIVSWPIVPTKRGQIIIGLVIMKFILQPEACLLVEVRTIMAYLLSIQKAPTHMDYRCSTLFSRYCECDLRNLHIAGYINIFV